MTTETVSKALGIPVRDVLKMIHAGKLPAVKVGGRWKIFDEDFQRWEGQSMNAKTEKAWDITQEQRDALAATPIGKTVNLDGRTVRVEASDMVRHDCFRCIFYNKDTAGCRMTPANCFPGDRQDGKYVIYRDVTGEHKTETPYTAAVAEQKPAGQIKMPEPAPAIDLDDVVKRLLPFEGDQDERMVWPLAKYVIEESDDGLFSTSAGEMFSGEYGTRDDAIDASRADLKIRLRAVLDLVEVKE